MTQKVEIVEMPVHTQCGYCSQKGLMCPLFKVEIINVNREGRRKCRQYINRQVRMGGK